MEHKSGCLFCGKELLYLKEPQDIACVFCKGVFSTQAKCIDNHFVCDACHALSANDLIERFTIESSSKDPIAMALTLMKSPGLKMHGPEHHFLIPAVLLSAFYNARGESGEKEKKIKLARKRAEKVLGGFYGFYGDCGAAVGTGIFVSVITGATPLSQKEWRLSNLMTAKSLYTIANAGGPRCCKRNSFLAIREAVSFVKDQFGVEIASDVRSLKCRFHPLNKECLQEACTFFPGQEQ
ncbi:MAG TPA: DUF5714 domain-containing protein [Syntrophorhabdales bacterium]|nr:DUF5714 domain-containing protein [Syntrophorhabdales bacterium]